MYRDQLIDGRFFNVPLLGELADLVSDLVGSGLEPCWRSSGVRNGRGGDTLSLGVKTDRC